VASDSGKRSNWASINSALGAHFAEPERAPQPDRIPLEKTFQVLCDVAVGATFILPKRDAQRQQLLIGQLEKIFHFGSPCGLSSILGDLQVAFSNLLQSCEDPGGYGLIATFVTKDKRRQTLGAIAQQLSLTLL